MSAVLGVIVPTVLGVGVLLSVGVLLRDAWERLHGPGWMSRRCTQQGRAAARRAAGCPPGTERREAMGLRRPVTYLLGAVLLFTLAAWLAVGSWGNYFGWRRWLESIAWIWLVFLLAATLSVTGGIACLLAARRSEPPAWVFPLLARTPLGRTPPLASAAAVVIPHPRHIRRARPPTTIRPLGPHHVTDLVSVLVRTVAGVWTLAAVAVVGWITLGGHIPTTPEELDSGIATPAWIVLYVALVASAVAVYRWELGGAIALAVCAAGLALLSSIQYPAGVALLLAGVFAVPAFLHWLAWQRDHHVHHLLRVAAATLLVVTGVWFGSDQVYGHYFGPTNPESSVAALPDSPLQWAWVGGTTSEATTVVARLHGEARRARLAVSTSADLADPRWSENASVDEQGVVRLSVENLSPATTYHWAVEVDGVMDHVRTGNVTTMPTGPASFTLVAAACARSGSNAAVFDAIRESEPLAYLQLGDLHYANIAADDPERFRAALQQLLTAPGQAALYRSTSIAYVWDDHDYSANDGNADSASRPAAEAVYRAWVPHHPLASREEQGPIGQSFVAGRVRVVMTDSRSQRTPHGTATGDAQQMLGAEQEQWFAAELAAARDAGQVVLWAASTPWIGEAGTSDDTWAGYPDARRRAADLVADAEMQDRLVYVAGDAHMVALDDGSHTDYSSAQVGGFPLLQAAALDRPGSVKGGPYSGGTFPGGGRYGEVEVRDEGGPTLQVTLRGRTWDGQTLVEQAFTLPVE